MNMIVSIPNEVRTLKATEKLLDRLYEVSKIGLKGDALALASGILPAEYRVLCQHDPHVNMMVQKGRADSEMEHASLLADASRAGDIKASLAILQHQHGWTSKEAGQSFGDGGIQIIIGDVSTHRVVEGERL